MRNAAVRALIPHCRSGFRTNNEHNHRTTRKPGIQVRLRHRHRISSLRAGAKRRRGVSGGAASHNVFREWCSAIAPPPEVPRFARDKVNMTSPIEQLANQEYKYGFRT